MSKEFEITVRTQDYDKVSISNFEENNLWISVWGLRAHCSTHMTREQVIELRNGLNQFLAMNEVANTAESA